MPKSINTSTVIYGMVGGGVIGMILTPLVKTLVDTRRTNSLKEQLSDGTLFDKDFSNNLVEFTEKHRWSIMVDGKLL